MLPSKFLITAYSSGAGGQRDLFRFLRSAGAGGSAVFNRSCVRSKSTQMASAREDSSRCISIDSMNPHIKVMQYAVRGPLVIRGTELEKELEKGVPKPFTEVIKANIGDCHAMGQTPITFIRQVLALVSYPQLFESSDFPKDVKKKAKEVLGACKGQSVGSYTDSTGLEVIRRRVAEYIERRDGISSSWENIVLSSGASDAIKNFLKLFLVNIDGKPPGGMVPIPQYPLYSASFAEYGIQQHGYYLDESRNWELDISELERSYQEGSKTSNIRVMVVINPGNPTGQVLSRDNIENIVKFAHSKKLFLMADEVYQDNVYAEGSKFYSMKKVLMEMGEPYCNMELASFMSSSKGYMGECGLRGGYAEIINICPQVKAMLFKCISAMLCPTVLGQTVMYCVVNPPKEGEESYPLYKKEKEEVLSSLKVRAKMVEEAFNSFEGYSCNTVQGAMYAFPQIKLPPKALEAAKQKGMPADTFYAFALLENAGVCIVPGTGFGQKPGTYHFRTTILPQADKLEIMLEKFRKFHAEFLLKYK